VLATLYPTREEAQLVLDEAGVDPRRIGLSNTALTNWHNILSEAAKQDTVQAITDVACNHFPENQALRSAVLLYAQREGAQQAATQRTTGAATEDIALWTTQLQNLRENLALIRERKSEYVLSSEIPLQLIREERRIEQAIADLERKLGISE